MSEHTHAEIRLSAMNILAMREQSRSELFRKLCQKFPDAKEQVETVIEELAVDNMQNDLRFAESFVHSRINKGHGPVRISAELRQKGIGQEVVSEVVPDSGDDFWFEMAIEAKERKFAGKAAKDHKEKAKQMRYLVYRGYTSQQAIKALAVKTSSY
ncbi:regulatory protein RecX [Endozoicomonas sp. OPT23]|uniref:regulatory protein RecX n=1 Tax=Endozoicomonas sp. OPT23 TaxID=2072845 RepID=UPI0018916DB5